MTGQTASKMAKTHGFRTLAEVSRISTVSRGTLTRWSIEKPVLFLTVLEGAKVMRDRTA